MIYESLACLVEEINFYFKSKFDVDNDKVVLSGIVHQDGTLAVREEDKVLLTLINVMKETIAVRGNAMSAYTGGIAVSAPPLPVNLYVLVSACFTNYTESLKFLSFVISFLQDKNVFNKTNTPKLPDNVEKLVFEMENLETERLSNIWTTLGAKYMPSVVYKVRMLTIDTAMVREYRPAVTNVSDSNQQKGTFT